MGKSDSLDLNFVAVGPQRTGTTWMYEMLRRHPKICVPEAVKETMFFDRYYERGLDWYRQYYREAGTDQLCGEVAPTYFDVPEVPARTQDISSGCTIFITLRNPVERARSLFLHNLKKGASRRHSGKPLTKNLVSLRRDGMPSTFRVGLPCLGQTRLPISFLRTSRLDRATS